MLEKTKAVCACHIVRLCILPLTALMLLMGCDSDEGEVKRQIQLASKALRTLRCDIEFKPGFEAAVEPLLSGYGIVLVLERASDDQEVFFVFYVEDSEVVPMNALAKECSTSSAEGPENLTAKDVVLAVEDFLPTGVSPESIFAQDITTPEKGDR